MTARSPYPFPGLRAFDQEESDIFFGREDQTDELLDRLSRTRFLAVVGPSGCGKSSLVRAGVVAGLEAGFVVDAGSRWLTALMTPGNEPMARLTAALMKKEILGARRLGNSPDPQQEVIQRATVEAILRRGPRGLVEFLRETPLDPPNSPPLRRTNLLILVDQFEELFRHRKAGGTNEADAFVALLLEASRQKEFPVYVVITMRSDFLGDCALFEGLPEAINNGQFLTPRMAREERAEAIVGPTRLFGGHAEPELVNRLLNDGGSDPDQLPLLQHVLMRLWIQAGEASSKADESSPPRVITVTDYDKVGGLSVALSDHAEKVYASLTPEQMQIAELLFKALCERGSDQREIRRPVKLGAVAALARVSNEEVAKVVEVFRAPGRTFLMPATGELKEETLLDISHESLIRHWKRLADWAKDEAAAADEYRYLSQTADRWKQGKAELWSKDVLSLARANHWRATHNPTAEWAKRYAGDFETAIEFLDASVAKRAEEEKQDQEDLQHSYTRKLIYYCGGILFVALAILAVVIYQSWQAQRKLTAVSRAIGLAEAALIYLDAKDRDPSHNLGMLTAIDSVGAARQEGAFVPARAVLALRFAKKQYLQRLNEPPPWVLPPDTLKELSREIPHLASPDGRFFAVLERNGVAAIRSTSDYSEKRTFKVEGRVTEMGFAAEPAQRFGVRTGNGRVFIWNLDSSKQLSVDATTLAGALGVPDDAEINKWIKKSPAKGWPDYDTVVLDALLECLSSVNRPLSKEDDLSLPQSRNSGQKPLTDTMDSVRDNAMRGRSSVAVSMLAKALALEDQERARKTIVYSFLNEADLLLKQSPEAADVTAVDAVSAAEMAAERLSTAREIASGNPAFTEEMKRANEILRKRRSALADNQKLLAIKSIEEANDLVKQGDKAAALEKYVKAKSLDPSLPLNPEEEVERRSMEVPAPPAPSPPPQASPASAAVSPIP